jgi:hypothetical protein
MAKPTKKAKRTAPRGEAKAGLTIIIEPPRPPSQEDFKRARDLLRKRADTLILDLAGRYLASNASELTTVLDALESLAELERMQRAAVSK